MTSTAAWPDAQARRVTAAYIASVQLASGEIPWETGGHTDVWDHVESAMGLQVAGHGDEARHALEWLRARQRADGSWARRLREGEIEDPGTDINQCAYVAAGVWHDWLARGDREWLQGMWPTVRRALDLVAAHQLPWGGFAWAVGADGEPAEEALVTGTASIQHALRCGAAIAEVLRQDGGHWTHSAQAARDALSRIENRFVPKSRYSMDWYYPVLTGAVQGQDGSARIDARWGDFVVPGLGIRCVDDHPWVTGAETCELALALVRLGRRHEAAQLVADMQHLREPDGSYFTGYVYPDDARWPVERSTWTAAAMILACDALEHPDGATARLFRS